MQEDIHACRRGILRGQNRYGVSRNQDTDILPLILLAVNTRILPGIFSHRPFQTLFPRV